MKQFWSGKRVLLTGHTGFKGAWLSLWLSSMGAKVHGLALDPPSNPNLYEIAKVADLISSDSRIDIRNYESVLGLFEEVKPEVVFHLAAQSLVNYSYLHPIETITTNVLGTANILEASRATKSVKVAVVITTDKCYENREWIHPYREIDALGGHDPYSSSKACAELIVASWSKSYCLGKRADLKIASARAGNVIGGGDWANQRLIPDFIRASNAGTSIDIRYPDSTRPWQHVLEPLYGYLLLAQSLASIDGEKFVGAWNFGPVIDSCKTVREISGYLAAALNVTVNMHSDAPEWHEAGELRLDSTKAYKLLNWHPIWGLDETLHETVVWYQQWFAKKDMQEYALGQIDRYSKKIKESARYD